MKIDETVRYYLMNLENRKCSIHTCIAYRRALTVLVSLLESLCAVVELERTSILHLRQCVQHLLTVPLERNEPGRVPDSGAVLSDASVCTYIRRWKSFFSWCFKEELLEKNPALRLEFPKVDERVVDAFSVEQIEQMLAVFDLSTDEGFRDYVIILLMLDTGIRRSEVATLRVEDIHDTYISVIGKGRKERQIGIHPQTSNLLWKYVHKYRRPARPDEPILFLSLNKSHRGRPFGRGGIEYLMKRLKEKTGIDDVRLSAHTFRHTFASMYLDEGGDLFSLSRELGHTKVNTTEKYLRSFTSRNARMHHNEHSPINRITLRSQHNKGKKKEKK